MNSTDGDAVKETISSYPLTLDQDHYLSNRADHRDRLFVHLVQSILFNERVLLSDSQVLSSQNLRALLAYDTDFVSLLNDGNLSIATRVVDGESFSLVDLNRHFIKINKLNPTHFDGLGDGKALLENEDALWEIDRRSRDETWDYKAMGNGFADSMDEFFLSERFARHFDDSAGSIFCNELKNFEKERRKKPPFQETPEEIRVVGRDIFQGEFQDYCRRKGLEISSQQSEVISATANANHKVNFPDRMKSAPIFDHVDEDALQILGRHSAKYEPFRTPVRIPLYLGPTQYSEGLRNLKTDDIETLRTSDAFLELRSLRLKYNDTDAYYKSFEQALERYVLLVQETIIERAERAPKKPAHEKFIELICARDFREGLVNFALSYAAQETGLGGLEDPFSRTINVSIEALSTPIMYEHFGEALNRRDEIKKKNMNDAIVSFSGELNERNPDVKDFAEVTVATKDHSEVSSIWVSTT